MERSINGRTQLESSRLNYPTYYSKSEQFVMYLMINIIIRRCCLCEWSQLYYAALPIIYVVHVVAAPASYYGWTVHCSHYLNWWNWNIYIDNYVLGLEYSLLTPIPISSHFVIYHSNMVRFSFKEYRVCPHHLNCAKAGLLLPWGPSQHTCD